MNRRSFIAASAGLTGGFLPNVRLASGAPPAERQFQLGCVTYNLLKDMDLETIITTLEAAGLVAVELRTTHKHGVEPSIGPAERAKVRERFQRSKVRLLSYGTECEFESPDPAVRKRQVEIGKTFVDLARDTGAIGVKVRPNGLPQGVPLATTIANISGGLHELGDYAQSQGIEIWMEVHGNGTQLPKNASDILTAANHKSVGACWNSNPTDVTDGSVKPAFDLLGKFIRNVHINDLYTTYPYREFFRLLRDSGYKRYTLAEVDQVSQEPVRFLRYYSALWQQLTT
jgi:sugar phosphate isomerase/epimerase